MHYGEQTSNLIPNLTSKVVVLPIGSLEQHGHHLPLLTDSLIGGEIARRAEAELDDLALFLPMLWCGASDHHLGLPGAVSVSNDTYTRLLMDLLESLIGHGFRRILLLNSHGGNGGPGGNAIYQVNHKHRDRRDLFLVLGSWFSLAGPQIAQIGLLEQKGVTHACELETSMILSTRPELVHMAAARGAHYHYESAFWTPDSSGPSRVQVARMFHQYTQTGALGHPEIATAEKGDALYAAVVPEVVALVREIAAWPPVEPN
jgi:creatinine amidohydrolase